jgi:hypothetical protein
MPSARTGHWRKFRQAGGAVSSLMAVAFVSAAFAIDVFPRDPLPYREGQFVSHDITARVGFSVVSQHALSERIQAARNATPARFQANQALIDEIVSTLAGLPGRLSTATRPADFDAELKTRFGLTTPEIIAAWHGYAEDDKAAVLDKQLRALREGLLNACVVSEADVTVQREQRNARNVILVHDSTQAARSVDSMVAVTDRQKLAEVTGAIVEGMDPAIRPSVRTCVLNVLTADKPLYTYDAAASQAEIERKIEAIRANPPTDEYPAGMVLVYSRQGAGEKQQAAELSASEMDLLAQEHKAYVAYEQAHHPWRLLAGLAGRAAVLLFLTCGLAAYVAVYHPRIIANHARGAGVLLLLLFAAGVGKLTVHMLGLNFYSAAFAVLSAVLTLTIAYDRRLALAAGAMVVLLVAFLLGRGFEMLSVLAVATTAGVLQLGEVRTRSKVIEAAAVAGALAFVTVCAINAGGSVPWKYPLTDGVWAAGAVLLAGMVLQVMLPLVERVFRVATSLTLLEWCDASKPLLKRLATEAPGTWNHCLQLGAMSESAADAIGARGLLARVGAYYHDIGKINKPDYFVENQGDGRSRHARLSPEMSLLVILGHVKDGLEMAREYGLPKVLHQFIATHHGTTLVQYFYHAAAEQRKAEADRAPEEVEFRYPGPKPQSKEAAILMLADAAESSVRSMSEPTPGRIESQVRTMVNRRLMDGQLDECEMTLREVHQVEASLVRSLASIYHSRIPYPTPAGQAPSAGEAQAERQARQDAEKAARKNGGESAGESAPPAGREPAAP